MASVGRNGGGQPESDDTVQTDPGGPSVTVQEEMEPRPKDLQQPTSMHRHVLDTC